MMKPPQDKKGNGGRGRRKRNTSLAKAEEASKQGNSCSVVKTWEFVFSGELMEGDDYRRTTLLLYYYGGKKPCLSLK